MAPVGQPGRAMGFLETSLIAWYHFASVAEGGGLGCRDGSGPVRGRGGEAAPALPASTRAEPSCFGAEAALDDLCAAAEPDTDDPDMDCG